MQLHHIKPKNKIKKSRRIGRGGKRGNYSGRGIKGQKSRAGAKIRPAIRDLAMKLPKQRGRSKHAFKSLFSKPVILNLEDIEKKFMNEDVISPQTLFEKNLINKKSGKYPVVKILGNGEITRKLSFQGALLSQNARAKIQKAGGIIK